MAKTTPGMLKFTTTKDIKDVEIDGKVYHFDVSKVDCIINVISDARKIQHIDFNFDGEDGDRKAMETRDTLVGFSKNMSLVLETVFGKEDAAELIGERPSFIHLAELTNIVTTLAETYSESYQKTLTRLGNVKQVQ